MEHDLALLRAFYDAYGDYFGADPEPLDPRTLDAADRATIAGLRAAIAMETRRAETLSGSVAKP